MLNGITVEAPAKINIGLKVFPRRADGYHDISSIFTTVSLSDTLYVEPIAAKNTCIIECDQMQLPAENTITKAYKAFCVLTGIKEGVRVKLTKRIPAGGGLGGGSSDSSSFIQSVDTLFGTQLSHSALSSIAGEVGSDVYFFTEALLAKKMNPELQSFAALVEGRGERVTPIPVRKDFSVVLVFPSVSVSTKEAYALVDETAKSRNILEGSDSLTEMFQRPIRNWFFFNDFTTCVSERYPEIADAMEALRSSGADFVDMSGSGSTVFGIFESEKKALQVQKLLARNWLAEFVTIL